MKPLRAIALLALLSSGAPRHAFGQGATDPFQWLADIRGDRAMAWVKAHNQSTLADLSAAPVYDSIYRRNLAIMNSKARIAYPDRRGKMIYNFWTDSLHPRGYSRRTTLAAYLSGKPHWQTVLDIDSLAAVEKTPWAAKGMDCLPPAYRRCMVSLSRGGGDAVETREFDVSTRTFVAGGFVVPEAKSGVSWVDDSTLLVSTDFGRGSMTTSGYPRIVKRWHRGTPLASAETVFEGKPTDVSVSSGLILVNNQWVPVIGDGITFFTGQNYVLDGAKLRPLDFPLDADYYTLGTQLIIYLRTDWQPATRTYRQGSLIAIDYRAFLGGNRAFQPVVVPDARHNIETVATTRSQILVKVLNNVRSELWRYHRVAGKWVGVKVPAPALADVSIGSTSPLDDAFFFESTSFVSPGTLRFLPVAGPVRTVAQEPAFFDATGLVVKQFEATSADGTQVPYFVVQRIGMPLDGKQPTILTAYGGFQISSLPYYDGVGGAAWLARGGVFVLANIRGGGEFGPAWHRAAQKEHKQRSYDDFLAVAQDLITRKITSPAHLGIEGGSNGGLLMGAAFTQRPDLFGAVSCEIPLLDMQHYTTMAAGASWIDEYGDPSIPEQWAYISKYSPYQNVFANRTYPKVLFTTTTSDDRVGPVHARKMTAKMEAMGYPVYYFENTEGGHGAGDTPEQRATMWAIVYSYFLKMLR